MLIWHLPQRKCLQFLLVRLPNLHKFNHLHILRHLQQLLAPFRRLHLQSQHNSQRFNLLTRFRNLRRWLPQHRLALRRLKHNIRRRMFLNLPGINLPHLHQQRHTQLLLNLLLLQFHQHGHQLCLQSALGEQSATDRWSFGREHQPELAEELSLNSNCCQLSE